MTATVARLRADEHLPNGVREELAALTDQQIEDAWQGASTGLTNGNSRDDIVKELEARGWSYDGAYWLMQQVRLYGEGASKPTEDYSKKKATAWLVLVGGIVVTVALQAPFFPSGIRVFAIFSFLGVVWAIRELMKKSNM
jgi:hypothetical protein